MSFQFLYIDDDVKRDFLSAPDDEVTDFLFPIPFGQGWQEPALMYRDRLRECAGVQLFGQRSGSQASVEELVNPGSLELNRKNGWSRSDPVAGVRFPNQRAQTPDAVRQCMVHAETLAQGSVLRANRPGWFYGRRFYISSFGGVSGFREWTPTELRPYMTDQQREIYGL